MGFPRRAWRIGMVQSTQVRSFPLRSIAEVLATFPSINPVEQEGYVVVASEFARVKVKHPG